MELNLSSNMSSLALKNGFVPSSPTGDSDLSVMFFLLLQFNIMKVSRLGVKLEL